MAINIGSLTGSKLRKLGKSDIQSLTSSELLTKDASGYVALYDLNQTQTTYLTASQLSNLSASQLTRKNNHYGQTLFSLLTTTQISGLSATVIGGLAASDLLSTTTEGSPIVGCLTATQVAGLKTNQLTAFKGTSNALLAALSDAQLQSLTSTQVSAFSTAMLTTKAHGSNSPVVSCLTADQVSAIVVSKLNATLVQALSATQASGFTSTQLAATDSDGKALLADITGAQMTGIAMSKLTTTQIKSLSTAQVAALTSTQLSATDANGQNVLADLTATQIAALDMTKLTSTQVSALSTTQVAALTSAQLDTTDANGHLVLADLTSDQIPALDMTKLFFQQVNALSLAQVTALTATQLTTTDASGHTVVADLTAAQIPVLDMTKLSSEQIKALSATQIAALTSTQLAATDANGNTVLSDFAAQTHPFDLVLNTDSGKSNTDGITNVGDINVNGLVANQPWQYTVDGGVTWNNGSGGKFSLPLTPKNYITNGDFSAGQSGWSTDSSKSPTISADEQTLPPAFYGGSRIATGLTHGQGGVGDKALYFISHCTSSTKNIDVWRTSVAVVGSTQFTFTGYAAFSYVNSNDSSDLVNAYFGIFVDGNQVGTTQSIKNAPKSTVGWIPFSQTLNLSEGSHTVSIRAYDDNGTYQNIFGLDSLQLTANSYTPSLVQVRQTLPNGVSLVSGVNQNITLDNTAPATPTLQLIDATASHSSSIQISGLDVKADSEVSIDGGAWQKFSGTTLSPNFGNHTYVVRQTDAAGNHSTSSATLSVNVSVASLTTEQIHHLSAQQVETFSIEELTTPIGASDSILSRMLPSQMHGFSAAFLSSQDASGHSLLSFLSPAQVDGLTVAQLTEPLSGQHCLLTALTTAQAQGLSSSQVAVLTALGFASTDGSGHTTFSDLPSSPVASTPRLDLLSHLSTDLVRGAAVTELEELDYQGLLGFFQKVSTGLQSHSTGLTELEFSDLQLVTKYVGAELGTSSYLYSVCNSLVNGDKLNTYYTNGGSSQATLGNLSVGSGKTQFDQLVATWFGGTNNPIEANGTQLDTDPLWGASGPAMKDIKQGSYGDCTGMAAIAAVFAQDPDYVKSLFTDNGNGTYGVRVGGQYYTLDNHFSSKGASRSVGSLWVRLLEEAWYQFSYDHLDFQSRNYESPYINAESLDGSAMAYFSSRSQINSASDFSTPIGTYASSIAYVRAGLQTAIEQGDYISYASEGTTGGRVRNHRYTVLGFDTATDKVTLYNPWGYKVTYALSDLFPNASDISRILVVDNPIPVNLPHAISLALVTDTGSSSTDGVTQSGTVQVNGLPSTGTWQFSTDAQMTWQNGTGNTLTLKDGDYDVQHVVVRTLSSTGTVTDMGGNTSKFNIDNVGKTPGAHLLVDSGTSSSDNISNQKTVTVDHLEDGGSWTYKVDDGGWQTGTGKSLNAQEGTHRYTLKQTDAAGNASQEGSFTATLDTTAPNAPAFALTSANTGGGGNLKISGLESGAVVDYSVDNGGHWLSLGAANSTGTFDITLNTLTANADRIYNGDFKAGATGWNSAYSSAYTTATLPTKMYNYTTGFSTGQEGAGDAAFLVRGLDLNSLDRDVWKEQIFVSSGSSYTLTGYAAYAVTSSLNTDTGTFGVFLDNTLVGNSFSIRNTMGWQAFSKTLSNLTSGVHDLSIRADMHSSYTDSFFALDSLHLTKSGSAIYDTGDIQVRETDVAGNSVTVHNASPIDWTHLNTNLAVL